MAIAEIFLTAFIQVLFEKLASRDLWNFARRERIDTLLKKWNRMLEEIGAVLADAEEKQMTDQWGGIKLWLEDLEDLAYDLDDILDEFATEALRQKVMEEPRASTSKSGKTTTTSFLAEATQLGYINVGDLVKDKNLHDGWDEQFDCHVINEDLVCDELEEMMGETLWTTMVATSFLSVGLIV